METRKVRETMKKGKKGREKTGKRMLLIPVQTPT